MAELVTRVNGTFGSLSFPASVALFSVPSLGRVLCTSSTRHGPDGMSMAGLEYPLCRCDRQGSLIISECSAAAGPCWPSGQCDAYQSMDVGGVAEIIKGLASQHEIRMLADKKATK